MDSGCISFRHADHQHQRKLYPGLLPDLDQRARDCRSTLEIADSTYSSYAFESFALFERGQWMLCLLNVLATNVFCFIAVVLGAVLARTL
jgi:hypothetical protein